MDILNCTADKISKESLDDICDLPPKEQNIKSNIDSILKNKSYIAIPRSMVNFYTSNNEIIHNECLVAFVKNLHAQRNLAFIGKCSATKSSQEWGDYVGLSGKQVLKIQKSLEKKLDFFSVVRERNSSNQWKRNTISFDIDDYAEDFKIRFNMDYIQDLMICPTLTALQKRMLIIFYIKAFQRHSLDVKNNKLQFTITYDEFKDLLLISRPSFNRGIKTLDTAGYIDLKTLKVVSEEEQRKTKVVHSIEITMPDATAKKISLTKDRAKSNLGGVDENSVECNENSTESSYSNNNITYIKKHLLNNNIQSDALQDDSNTSESSMCSFEKVSEENVEVEKAEDADVDEVEELQQVAKQKYDKIIELVGGDHQFAVDSVLKNMGDKAPLVKDFLGVREQNPVQDASSVVEEAPVAVAIDKPAVEPSEKPVQVDLNDILHAKNKAMLSGKTISTAKNYAKSIKRKNIAKGYAATISESLLFREIVHFLAQDWRPTMLNIKNEDERQASGLRTARGLIVSGKWKAPHFHQQVEILNRENQAYIYGFDNYKRMPDLQQHNQRVEKFLATVEQGSR